jgi:aspartate 1-decarboxylase
MQCFGITVKGVDNHGSFYVNHTVLANDLEEADKIIINFYLSCKDEKLLELDQAILLENKYNTNIPQILETLGKIYFTN